MPRAAIPPQPGDIIYFKSSRNSNITNHVGIVTGYSNGTVYTIEGNTSSATISTNGGAVCEKAYSITNTYIVYICSPAYKNTAQAKPATIREWLTGSAKDLVFDEIYYGTRYPSLKAQFGTDEAKLFDYFITYGLKEGHCASPIFDVRYYVENNADVKAACGTNYEAALKHFVTTGINEARVMAKPLDLGESFQARIGYPYANLNFSLSDTNVITYGPSDAAAQIWTFQRHPSGAYRIINSKNGYSLAVDGYEPQSDVSIAEYKDSRRQLWFIYESADGRYVFRSMAASDCVLDVYGGSAEPLMDIWTYTYNATHAQHFSIDKLSGLEDLTPVDLGTGFYAKINASEGMNLSLCDSNVIIYGDSTAKAQLWRFDRQADGSYEIVNQKTGDLLDVYWATSISGANVQIFQDHDNIAQRWFIYNYGGQYVFRPACSGTCVLTVESNGTTDLTNVGTYVFNGSDAQLFQIKKVDKAAVLTTALDIGTDFYARINVSEGKNLSLNDNNVIIYNESTAPAQIWKFVRQTDGTYKIINQKNGKLLDVYWAKDESGTNVQIYRDTDSVAHKWYIHTSGDGYVFRPCFSNTRVMEVEGNGTANGTNVHINDFSDSDAQIFDIVKIDDYLDLGTPVDLGTGFFARIGSLEGFSLSQQDSNVVINSDSRSAAQVWKFERQTNGGYKIINQSNGKLLDVYWASDVSGTNVQLYNDTNSIAHLWYIYEYGGGYVFRPACSNSRVLDVYGAAAADMTNVQIYDFNGSAAQIFTVERLDEFVDLGIPVDLGTDFAVKINASTGMNLSLCDTNVIIYGNSSAAAQIWEFHRQTDGSYKLLNSKTATVMDVYWAKDESGTNVQIYPDNTSDANRWYVYDIGGQYVFRPACSYGCVLNVAGNGTEPMTNVEISTYTGEDGQRFRLISPETASTSENMIVLRKIMYAVETGGQVYGNADYADFTEAYTNTPEEHAITIGAGQWFGPEAKTLLNMIREADYATFSALDTAGIEYDLDNANWSTYKLSKTSAKAKCIQKIISSDVGKACQDQLMDKQLAAYMKEAAALGVTDEAAQMMCANIRHLGGLKAVKRILGKTAQPYTIHSIYEAMGSDTGNQVGTFRSRNKMVYESLLKYLK